MLKDNPYYKTELKKRWEEEKAYKTLKEFSDDNNISYSYMYTVLHPRKYRYKPKPQIKFNPFTEEVQKKIEAEYRNGSSIDSLYNKYFVNWSEMQDFLYPIWSELQVERYWDNSNNIYNKSIKELICEGYELKYIAFLFSVSVKELKKAMAK